MAFVNLTITISGQVARSGADPFSGVQSTFCVSTTEGAGRILERIFQGGDWIEFSDENENRWNNRKWIRGFRRDQEVTQAPQFPIFNPSTIARLREVAAT